MNRLISLLIVFFVHFAQSNTAVQTWTPKPSSDVTEFTLQTQVKKLSIDSSLPADTFTDARFAYTAKNPLNYGIVQFVRGCMFESYQQGKAVHRVVNVRRFHMGEYKKFLHKNWELDTFTFDPLYTSYDSDRFHSLRWNADSKDLSVEKANRVSVSGLPNHGRVFDSDLPGQASVIRNQFSGKLSAKNPSLEFKACLFKLSDLPEKTDKAMKGIDINKALHCFGWSHNYEYNFETKQIEKRQQIADICTK